MASETVVDAAVENLSGLLFWRTKSVHLHPAGLAAAVTHDSSIERVENSTRSLSTIDLSDLEIIVGIV